VFKIFFYKKNQKECIKSYNRFQIFCTTKHSPLYKTHSSDELDEKKNLEGKGYKAKDSF